MNANEYVIKNARYLHEGCYYVHLNGSIIRAESPEKLVEAVKAATA